MPASLSARAGRYLMKAALEPAYALRVARMRGLAMLARLLPGGYSAPPETISLNVTRRCNLRCRMCGQWNEECGANTRGPLPDERVMLDAWIRLFDEVAPYGPNITLFGGEPLVLGSFGALVAAAKRRGLRVNMVSNMTLAHDRAEEIVRSGIDEIIVSLDGPREVHDAIRGATGTFNRVVRGLLLVDRIRRALGRDTPRVNISCTLSRLNEGRLDGMPELAAAVGARTLTFHHLIHVSEETYARSAAIFRERFGVEPSDFRGFILPRDVWGLDPAALADFAERMAVRRGPVWVSFYPSLTRAEILRYYTEKEFVPDSHPRRCVSPWITAYVFPDGSVRPCLSTCHPVGNVLERPFLEIWNGERMRAFRRDLKRRGAYPFCTKCTEHYRF